MASVRGLRARRQQLGVLGRRRRSIGGDRKQQREMRLLRNAHIEHTSHITSASSITVRPGAAFAGAVISLKRTTSFS
jgi:hypothetical protein